VPPEEVTEADQRTAWDHPYHAPGAAYALQEAHAPDAAWRPVEGAAHLEVRDAATWEPTGGLVATWIVRPAAGAQGEPHVLGIPGEAGGLDVLYMMHGSARFTRKDGEPFDLNAGDTLTVTGGVVGQPFDVSADMRLIRFFVASRAELLRERTPQEIETLEALGAGIVTHREPRPQDDTRPVNMLHF